MLEGSSADSLERVADFGGPMPTGVTVSEFGRIFVNFPRWGDEVPVTVTELIDGQAVAYPDEVSNSPRGDDDRDAFVSVQSVVVDPVDRLWVLDTGSPMMRPTKLGGPKLVCVDMESNSVVRTIVLPREVAFETTYLNDVRFDLRRGGEGVAFITDSSSQGPNALIVVDLATGESWRRLHGHSSTRAEGIGTCRPIVEGHPFVQRSPDGTVVPVAMGADGITINADGSRLYYCPLASRRLYSVSVDALADRSLSEDAVAETVVDEGDKGTGADGLEADDAGRLYVTSYEHNAVFRRLSDGQYETVAHSPDLLWPDTLSIAVDGYLYITANQLHRQAQFQSGQDRRRPPYQLFRKQIQAGPVLLRP